VPETGTGVLKSRRRLRRPAAGSWHELRFWFTSATHLPSAHRWHEGQMSQSWPGEAARPSLRFVTHTPAAQTPAPPPYMGQTVSSGARTHSPARSQVRHTPQVTLAHFGNGPGAGVGAPRWAV
jgi:hypothetical protein